jgi:hypothetical protein
MASDAERRLKELEAQVRAERATHLKEQAAMVRASAPSPVPVKPDAATARPKHRLRNLLGTWKGRLLLVGGVLVAGAVTLWVVEKLFKIALYVGAAAAVAFAIWWLVFRKKK